MGTSALIYLQPGRVAARKQATVCLNYAMTQGWRFSIVRAGALEEAVRLIREGLAQVLLLAYRDDQLAAEIQERVESAGGRVEFCGRGHSPAPRRQLSASETESAALRMHELGATTDEIVQLLRVPAQRLRDLLRRRPPQ